MNVLLVLPDHVSRLEASSFWDSRLTQEDHLFILILDNSNSSQTQRGESHSLEFDYAKLSRWSLLLWRIFSTKRPGWSGKARTLRSPFLWRIWPDFCWNIQSFDPDIVDLRWMPGGRLVKHRLTKQNCMRVLSAGDTVPRVVDSSWRRYDPGVKASIVLPVYNGARYLRQSIESCLQQTHRNLELLLVDDCSTDETPQIIADYAQQDSRIIALQNARNLRLAGALNVGFERTTGDLLTWTSHDNCYAPDAIETLVRYLCTWHDVDFVYSAYRIIDELGQVAPRVNHLPPPWELPYHNTVGACFLYSRKVYETVGEYSEDLEYMEDYEYWVRVYKKGFRMMRLHMPLYYYRRHPDSMTARARNLGDEFWGQVRRKHFPNSGSLQSYRWR